MNCFFAVLLVTFVFGVLSFGDPETLGIKTLGNLAKTSFVIGYQACDLTGFCGTDVTESASNFFRSIKRAASESVREGNKQLRKNHAEATKQKT